MNDSVLNIADSLAVSDSTALTDSLTLISEVIADVGLEGLVRPSLSSNEPWVFVVLLLLFLSFTFILIRSGGMFIQQLKTIFSHKKEPDLFLPPVQSSVLYPILINIFSIFVFSLMAHQLLVADTGSFEFTTFAAILGLLGLFLLLKYLLFEIVGRTFFEKKMTGSFIQIYFNLIYLYATALFPLLVLYTYQPGTWQLTIALIALLLLVFTYVVLIVKVFQIFYTKPLALLYIFLYLCTLEILPILALFQTFEKLMMFV